MILFTQNTWDKDVFDSFNIVSIISFVIIILFFQSVYVIISPILIVLFDINDGIITPTIMNKLYIIGTVEKSETIICSICLEINSEIETQCKHPFCKKCIVKWINTNKISCPICRQSFENGFNQIKKLS